MQKGGVTSCSMVIVLDCVKASVLMSQAKKQDASAKVGGTDREVHEYYF
jgi:hypothetical protein